MIYESLAVFYQKLFRKANDKVNPFKLELKTFVDGLATSDPILEGYMVTFEFTIKEM